jgi:hypothetical protein
MRTRMVLIAALLTIGGLGMSPKPAAAAGQNWSQRVNVGYVIAMDSSRANALAANLGSIDGVATILSAFLPRQLAIKAAIVASGVTALYAAAINYHNRRGRGIYILVTWWGSMFFESQ